MVGQGNGLKIQLVRFELSPSDAELFVKFRKYQDSVMKILESGALDIHEGSFTCFMDGEGVLRKVQRSDYIYKQ